VRTLIELGEYDRKTERVDPPTSADLDLAARLNSELERKLELRWLQGDRLEVVSSSWVGVVHLTNVSINVRPKYVGSELGVVQMLSYANDPKSFRRISGQRTLDAKGSDLVDLICLLLAEEAQMLLRDGLLHDYVTEEDSLTTLRGSLRFREQAIHRYGQLDVLECRFDDFRSDVIENQLLRTGLSVAARVAGPGELQKRLRRLELATADLTELGPNDSSFYRERIAYARRNERYRSAHDLAYLLLDNVGVHDLFGQGRAKSFAFLLNMNRLFEIFVTTLVDEAFAREPWRVTGQRSLRSVIQDRVTGRRYASIIPDIVMSNGSETVPFDCKYKLYGSNRKISTSDIFQSFVYAYALSSDSADGTRAGIIYPATDAGRGPLLAIRSVDGPVGAALTGIAIDIPAVLAAISHQDEWEHQLKLVRELVGGVLNPVVMSESR